MTFPESEVNSVIQVLKAKSGKDAQMSTVHQHGLRVNFLILKITLASVTGYR